MCRKVSLQILLVLLIGLVAGVAQADIASDLLGYWALDGNVDDSSGNGYHGEAFGDPTYVDGTMGQAMEFTGDQSVYIEDFTGIVGADVVTLCMWVVPYRNSGEDQVMWFNDEDGSYGRVRFGINGDEWEFKHGDGSGNPTPDDSENPIILNEWVHLVGVRKNNDRLELFVNGISVDEQSFGSAGVAEPQVAIGAERRSSTSVRNPFEGIIDEVRIYTRALSIADIQELFEYKGLPPVRARSPQPGDGATDVPHDGMLSWTSGDYAQTHSIYLGVSLADINDAAMGSDLLISENQTSNSLVLPALDFGRTYYWRVDEVNALPDATVFKGYTWSFTVEPAGIPIETITATASGANPGMVASNTIDGSGLDDMDRHSIIPNDMWLAAGTSVWIQYEFDQIYKLHEMLVWNSNQQVEAFIGFGIKEATVETSIDGETWAAVQGVPEFAQATGMTDYTANTTVDLGSTAAKYVKITGNSGHGTIDQMGLSEVRFFYIPTSAREPQPIDQTTTADVDVELSWRSGREAVSHAILLSTDREAVVNATAVVDTVSEPRYLAVALDYDTTYYWQTIEVNEAQTPSAYASDIWSFTTPEYGTVDDFESYSGEEGQEVFMTWFDGFGGDASLGGSTTGHIDGPFVETTVVNSGSKSMPIYYDNDGGFFDIDGMTSSPTFSEVVHEFGAPQDWTAGGIKTLSVMFAGDAGNTVGQLYCKIGNAKLLYEGDATNLALGAWQAWNIDLSTVGGNLGSVGELAIGVEGSGAGVLYIDDIRLYPRQGELIVPAEPGNANLLAYYPFEGNANTVLYKLFNGFIDEVQIYGRALSAEEILWGAGKTKPVHKPF